MIVEAMATRETCGRDPPCWYPIPIEHGVNGLLVPEHAPDELAEAIAQFVDPEIRQRIGANGRQVYESRFCLRTLTRKLEGIYIRRQRVRGGVNHQTVPTIRHSVSRPYGFHLADVFAAEPSRCDRGRGKTGAPPRHRSGNG